MVVIVAELSEMSPGTEAWAPLPLRVGRRLLHGQPGWGWNCSWAQAGASLSGLSESAYPRKRGVDEWVIQAIARCWDLQSWEIPHILLPTEGSDFNSFPGFTITPKELDQIHRWQNFVELLSRASFDLSSDLPVGKCSNIIPQGTSHFPELLLTLLLNSSCLLDLILLLPEM